MKTCLSLMYLRIDSFGFCNLSAKKLGDWMGTTDTSVRRFWTELKYFGYISSHTIEGERRVRKEVRGHYLMLSPDGGTYKGLDKTGIGTEDVQSEESEEP